MKDCIFCSIANGPAGKLVWQNDIAVAFKDANPSAPIHILVVPKEHVKNLDELEDVQLGGEMLQAVREVATQVGVKKPYKVMIYGELVHHLHFHVMGESS